MTTNIYGWICPLCGRVHSPQTLHCDVDHSVVNTANTVGEVELDKIRRLKEKDKAEKVTELVRLLYTIPNYWELYFFHEALSADDILEHETYIRKRVELLNHE